MSEIPEISAQQLQLALAADQPVRVLDVRSSADRAEWWIPASTHVDAGAELKQGRDEALAAAVADWPREVPVVAVCGRGNTSKQAAQVLVSLGFKCRSLTGGMGGWSEAWNVAEVALPGGGPAILQVRRTGKGCLSYLVISGKEAVVVDPSVAPQVYEDLAAERGARILAVLDTHVHADHVSRAQELGRRTGAEVCLPAQNRVNLPFHALEDGAEVRVGNSRIRCIATPGHTHESMSYLVDNTALLTGDTLFVRGVGRPDLKAEGDESRRRAALLYRSLTGKIFALNPGLIVLPCHSPEPIAFDGVAHATTLAEARAASGLAGQTEELFVAEVLSRIPATPPNHLQIVRINEGREPAPEDLAPLEAGANRCAIPVR